MYIILSILSLCLIGMIAFGIYFEINPFTPEKRPPDWVKGSIGVNLITFTLSIFAILFFGIQEVMAIPAEIANEALQNVVNSEFSIGRGMAIIGVGLPTCFSTIAAAYAVGPIGAASLAAISEKPENFGRSLIYLGLAEGIAIYGLIVSILLMNKI